MNLTEYLNQADPVFYPNVILKKEEINVLTTIKVAGEERSLVTIKSDDPIVKDLHYCMVRGSLWAMDGDGNPRARSVFRLE